MTIFKRTQKGVTDDTYSYKFTHAGKQLLRKTPFTDRREAEKAAKDHLALLQTGKFEEAAKIRSRAAGATTTLAKLEEAYKTAPVDAGTKTRKNNYGAFRIIVRKIYATTSEDVGTLSGTIINADLAEKWFTEAANELGTQSQLEQGSTRRTANSTMQQAKSLFTPRALDHYAQQGLQLPYVHEFLAKVKARKFTKAVKKDYNPPADKIIALTLKAWAETKDRNLFLTIGHALAYGLRKGEIAQARWNWHTTRDGVPCLDGQGDFKNGSGLVQVRALDPFYTTMQNTIRANDWEGKPGDYIITGTDTYRTNLAFRNASEWMRAIGWNTQKAVHEFRAYSGSQVAMRYGIYEAMTWLRHSSVKVTEMAYSRYVKQFRPGDPASLAARWATAAPAGFVPQVLPQAASA